MSCFTVWLLFAIIYCIPYSDSSNIKMDRLPFSEATIPSETPEPININTTNIRHIVTKPLTYMIHASEKVELINTGYSVEVILKSRFSSSFVFGGVLYKNVYIYSRQKYYFTPKKGGIAGDTVDGKEGEQLVVCIYYYHIKYGSFENALNYRDGIFETRIRVIVGGIIPNPLFVDFKPYLKKIKNPGSSVEMPISPTFAFFNKFPKNVQYFAYPGSFCNETTGKQHYSTITNLHPVLPYRFISRKQFDDTFGCMLNTQGRKLNTAVKQAPAGDRPIVSTTGIREIIIPFGLFPSKPGGI